MKNSPNVVEGGRRLSRLMVRLSSAFRQPRSTLTHLKKALFSIHSEHLYKKSPIPTTSLAQISPPGTQVSLESFENQDGNVTYLEMLSLASLVATLKPKSILEIGTFDGNSTLQMALNAPKKTKIHTLDLPPKESTTHLPIEKEDVKYTCFSQKRKFIGTSVEPQVVQHFGDSTQIDFLDLSDGKKFDFIFIDGGHSFECVQSDTRKSLESLSPGGTIVWHDYGPHWMGIYKFLSDLSQEMPLQRIEGTTLVFYSSSLSK